MEAILVHQSGPHKGRKERLSKKLTSLGRRQDNHIVLSETEVSNCHAQIQRDHDTYTLIDLESTNGTFINGKRIRKSVLHNHDKIELGQDGPVLEFLRARDTESGTSPQIVPISGWWEHGKGPIQLKEGKTILGRGKESDIVVGRSHEPIVSVRHVEIMVQSNSCSLEDLDSTNGTFLNGGQVRVANLHHGDHVELGRNGPEFEFHWRGEDPGHRVESKENMVQKLKNAASGGRAGEQTMIILHAAHEYYKRRRWPWMVTAIVCLILFVAAGYIAFQKIQENEQLRQQNRFYDMRSYQMELVSQRDSLSQKEKISLRKKRLDLLAEYEKYLEKVNGYAQKSPKEKAVLRLARNLGETSLEVPPDFIARALDGVEQLKRTSRLASALARARQKNLLIRIRSVLDQYDLPHEFIFIPFAESDFRPDAVGPETPSHEFAKGMWMLMPKTAHQYALNLGPLEKMGVSDPMDERHIADLSTQAAVKYLADLYSSKAAASGLLVIASYNYGSKRIIDRLDSLPNEPKLRNFWHFYRQGWVPDETRNYVMGIFSAALICLNPQLFDVKMESLDKE